MDINEVYEATEQEFFGSVACQISANPHTAVVHIETEIERRGLVQKYIEALNRIVGLEIEVYTSAIELDTYSQHSRQYNGQYGEYGYAVLWSLIHATPLQRCQAALECIE